MIGYLGDSLTQGSYDQSRGFALAAELQAGEFLNLVQTQSTCIIGFCYNSWNGEDMKAIDNKHLAYIRRMDVINRGFR